MTDGNKVRDPGMVKRSDPSFPCASLDVGLGLRLAYAVDQEHRNSFSSRLCFCLSLLQKGSANFNVTVTLSSTSPAAEDLFCPIGSTKQPPYVLLLTKTEYRLIRDP